MTTSGAMISVKEWDWIEDETMVTITLHVPIATAKNVDIFASEVYVKVFCSPYLWQADLVAPIDEGRSSVAVGDGIVKLTLAKVEILASLLGLLSHFHFQVESGLWGSLLFAADKAVLKERRTKSIQAAEKREQDRTEAKKRAKSDAARHALEAQMELDRQRRETVEKQKASEKATAEVRSRTFRTHCWLLFCSLAVPSTSFFYSYRACRFLCVLLCMFETVRV